MGRVHAAEGGGIVYLDGDAGRILQRAQGKEEEECQR